MFFPAVVDRRASFVVAPPGRVEDQRLLAAVRAQQQQQRSSIPPTVPPPGPTVFFPTVTEKFVRSLKHIEDKRFDEAVHNASAQQQRASLKSNRASSTKRKIRQPKSKRSASQAAAKKSAARRARGGGHSTGKSWHTHQRLLEGSHNGTDTGASRRYTDFETLRTSSNHASSALPGRGRTTIVRPLSVPITPTKSVGDGGGGRGGSGGHSLTFPRKQQQRGAATATATATVAIEALAKSKHNNHLVVSKPQKGASKYEYQFGGVRSNEKLAKARAARQRELEHQREERQRCVRACVRASVLYSRRSSPHDRTKHVVYALTRRTHERTHEHNDNRFGDPLSWEMRLAKDRSCFRNNKSGVSRSWSICVH